jgi:acetyltransferase-like isoleucine patch superfamily enzyme
VTIRKVNSAKMAVSCAFIRCLPQTRLFGLKRWLLRWAGVAVADNVRVVSSARIMIGGTLSIGTDTWVGHEVLIVGGGAAIEIGDYCDIAPRVTFLTGSHEIDRHGLHIAGKGYSLPILVENGCWICAGATILGGTRIGARSIVAAGAVVKGDFPAGSLIGGVPARTLRTLGLEELN